MAGELEKFLSDQSKLMAKAETSLNDALDADDHDERFKLLNDATTDIVESLKAISTRLDSEIRTSRQVKATEAIEAVRLQLGPVRRANRDLRMLVQNMQNLDAARRNNPFPREARDDLQDSVAMACSEVLSLAASLDSLPNTLQSSGESPATIGRGGVRLNIERHRRDEIA
ncbi:hypothetical protein AB0O34_27180 [Sphaerisporangium sp. NPDC088356]|uniref:hypothetical protein n=1 Tax=Sphaerisporangium sp. NPDC088356 TaxID=3154871 RepID=UPI00342430A4